MTPASIIPVFGSQRPYADLNFAGGSFGLDGRSVSDLTALPGFTFTRASLAMGYDATGKLTYGPNNLCAYSQQLDNAAWTKNKAASGVIPVVTADQGVAPDGTLTADLVVFDAGPNSGADYSLLQTPNFTTIAGQNSLYSIWLKTSDGTTKTVQLSISGAAASVVTVTGTWARYSVVWNASGGTWNGRVLVGLGLTSATASLYAWGAQLEAVTYQTTPSTYYPTTTAAYYGPRLVYDPVTLASQGILVEEARTNLCLQSNTLDSWTLTNATVTANAKTGPDGTASMDRFIPNSGTTGLISQNTTGSSSTVYTCSIYVDVATNPLDQFTFYYGYTGALGADRTGVTVTVSGLTLADFTAGAGVVPTSKSITLVTGTIYRLVFTFTSGTVTSPAMVIRYSGASADGTKGVSFWGCQLEAGTGASSPIPTTTASVTRAADDAVMTGLSLPGPCSFATEALAPAFVSTDARHTLSDGNTNNRLWLSYNGSVLSTVAIIANSGVSPVATAALAGGVAFKAAQSSNNGTYLSVVNGGTVETASGGVMPTLTRLDIGKNAASSLRYWNSPISRIRIYNRALSDAQLQSLTT